MHPLVFTWGMKSPGLFSSSIAQLSSRGPSGLTAEALTTAWPPSRPRPRLVSGWRVVGEEELYSSLVCDPFFSSLGEQETRLKQTQTLSEQDNLAFRGVIGANRRPARRRHRTPPRSLRRRPQNNTRSGSHGEEKKKEVTSHKSFVQPFFLRRKPQRKTDPSPSVSFLNRQFLCPFFNTLLVKKNTAQ